MDKRFPSTDSPDLLARIGELEAEISCLRDFTDLSSDWFWEQDAEFRFVRFFGNSPEKLRRNQADFIGRRRWEMPIRGVSPAALAEHVACCERHEPFRDFVYEILGDDETRQYYSISGTPVFDGDGEFCGYHGVGRNITELREAERAIAESGRRLAQIIDGNPVPIFVIDAEHRVTHWNQACESLTGVPAGRMVGERVWGGVFPAPPRPTMADLVVGDAPALNIVLHYGDKYRHSRLIHDGFEAEDYFPQMVGGGRWLFFTAAPLYDSSGRIAGAIETLQDVTARKNAEHAERESWTQLQEAHVELQLAMRRLVEAEKLASLGRLVAGIAHELNTPLGNALMVATTLAETIDELGRQISAGVVRRSEFQRLLAGGHAATGMLTASITRAGRLVSRFREIAVPPGDRSPKAVFQLCSVFSAVSSEMAERLAGSKVSLIVVVPDDIVLESHPDALGKVAACLIENALIHGFAGRDGGTIRVAATAANGEVVIDVADDGCGMTAEVRRHAFDPFYTTRLGQGESGLGLYVVHNLVTGALGGRIELVDSTQNDVGAMFRIVLPLSLAGDV